MTTDVKQPYTRLVGDGSNKTFTFEFPIVETLDLLTIMDGVLLIEYSSYTVQNLTENGGDIVFAVAPVSGADVLILRRTTISQQVDYTESPFMAQSHEDVLDKIVYILQELINGAWTGVDEDGNLIVLTFDLSVTAGVASVTINNSGGTDAVLPKWESATTAGVFHGEITTTAPVDGGPALVEDGYVVLVVEP